MLKIMGLGPGAYEALTIGALKELKNNKNIYFRTEKHPTVDFLKDEGIKFESYDHAYEKYDSFDDVLIKFLVLLFKLFIILLLIYVFIILPP